ncbi:CheR family methyltransferase [Paludisphaera borealis]|uniref:Putative biofilm formation methyltransferase WspC n=1 Tax=Paludisphaera borealis TaxID=1387353 RepID=A0A1U7CIQ2_9BACT|nr:CheR family methyltransferase [Paludisphaera borealis]APW58811.1 putative biofilm formation methyltransferase WspC [Paludisphaera borealis]
MSGGLAAIDAILTGRLGLDPSAIGSGLIPRAVRSRMKAVGLHDLEAYAALVRGSEAEVQELIEEVVVPESWFFRDVLPFRFLLQHARSCWTVRPKRAAIRVLSIPCAGGEEPYSIAVALDEAGLPPDRCRIDAVDVSAHRLALARQGVFSRNALRGMSPDVVARWFREHPQGLQIVDAIRRRVHFQQGNILDSRLLADETPYDVIFCRNLLIYLNAGSRAEAAATLDRLLAADGVLIVGHADPLGPSTVAPKFVLAAEPGAFAYRRRTETAIPSPIPIAPAKPFVFTPFGHQDVHLVEEPESAPAAAPVHHPDEADARPMLEEAAEHANQGRHGQALACCEAEIRRKGPSAAALALMGVIHQAAGRRAQAESCFHKAIYLDPHHDEALLALALIAERRGDRSAASGFRRRADRALKNKGASSHE